MYKQGSRRIPLQFFLALEYNPSLWVLTSVPPYPHIIVTIGYSVARCMAGLKLICQQRKTVVLKKCERRGVLAI